ncbi:rCG38068 [Rattus norvegicus]|uniref:RCG38068 n=1 Tax=Rattus norvegicus TaxID=10116 RepID=A6IV31_RAT|nr:rCG38068 [Rattus norvegicus]
MAECFADSSPDKEPDFLDSRFTSFLASPWTCGDWRLCDMMRKLRLQELL